jgi:hypothetical protein
VNTWSCDLFDMMVLVSETDRLFKAVLSAFWAIGCQADMRNVSTYYPYWVVRQKVSRYQLGNMRKLSDSLPYLGGYTESLYILIVLPAINVLRWEH